MHEAWQQITEGLASLGGEDPALRGGVLVGTGAVALLSLVTSWWRGRRADRVKVSVNAPSGEAVFIQIGEDVEEERPAKGKGA